MAVGRKKDTRIPLQPRRSREPLSNREVAVDYVRRVLLAVASHPEDYIPDGIYAEDGFNLCVNIGFGMATTVSCNYEMYVERD